ncbi:uncharacterized protein LOC120354358 [Nilaparvata lugens]|uniref:uncharacterized protein LOC120354358 n=1 Tax=Nilaparvata lugens TaxID=108931 RepID=UPI00193DBAD4|nr:uncharacterized protein LOC120354358 [Nilaparvata lugens]
MMNNEEDNCVLLNSIDEVNLSHIPQSNNLTILHQNIQGISSNFDKFVTYLSCWNVRPAIVVLSEVWLDTDDQVSHYFIEGYEFYSHISTFTRATGIVVYYSSELVDFNCNLTDCELSGADVLYLQCALSNYNFNLICLYRWHGFDCDRFLSSLDSVVARSTTCDTVLIGDVNINILINDDNKVDSYLEILSCYGFEPVINIPTRVTETTATLIYHVFIRSRTFTHFVRGAVIETLIGDHRAVSLTLRSNTMSNIEGANSSVSGPANTSASGSATANRIFVDGEDIKPLIFGNMKDLQQGQLYDMKAVRRLTTRYGEKITIGLEKEHEIL